MLANSLVKPSRSISSPAFVGVPDIDRRRRRSLAALTTVCSEREGKGRENMGICALLGERRNAKTVLTD